MQTIVVSTVIGRLFLNQQLPLRFEKKIKNLKKLSQKENLDFTVKLYFIALHCICSLSK